MKVLDRLGGMGFELAVIEALDHVRRHGVQPNGAHCGLNVVLDRRLIGVCCGFLHADQIFLRPNVQPLIFTYHHSRTEGWVAVYEAIQNAGFTISQVFPIKAEMAVSVAIMAAKEPINYDLVFVCRKRSECEQMRLPLETQRYYAEGIERIKNSGLLFSKGDMMVFKYGIALKQLSESGKTDISKTDIERVVCSLEKEE